MENYIYGERFDEERALYALCNAKVASCSFRGERDGESALKESKNIEVCECDFALRYPLWHSENICVSDSNFSESCRAPLWYSKNGRLSGCTVTGVKCLRECENISFEKSNINSSEFGWKCKNLSFTNCEISSEYLFFDSENIEISNLSQKGKYSFQYVKGANIDKSFLDTKDAFWHSKNITVKNSTILGEYLGWYSENLTLINCRICGTQPLCYCKNLTLIDCYMENTDLAFEYSEVYADIRSDIISVKNPLSGKIIAEKIGEIILDGAVYETNCEIKER